jgi:hypothetical protein
VCCEDISFDQEFSVVPEECFLMLWTSEVKLSCNTEVAGVI